MMMMMMMMMMMLMMMMLNMMVIAESIKLQLYIITGHFVCMFIMYICSHGTIVRYHIKLYCIITTSIITAIVYL
jgi:hypothetical protein